jgi:hypothetical protein
VLVIAPESDLNTVADIVAAANGFRVNVLRGYVTGRETLKEIGSGQYDVVYFGGHAHDEDSLRVSDGPLDEEYLKMALRNASSGRLELVILNSCGSVAMAASLYRAGVAPRVIGWAQDVSDETAGRWAQAFFTSAAMGVDYWEAYMGSTEVMRALDAGFTPPILLNGRITLLEVRVAAIQAQLAERDGMLMAPRWVLGLLLAIGLAAAVATALALLR